MKSGEQFGIQEKLKSKKVKMLLVKFLLLMIVFTLLSRVATNYAMAKVVVEKATYGSISNDIESIAVFDSVEKTISDTEPGLPVKEIHVVEGQVVSTGEILYKVDVKHLEQMLTSAKNELNILDMQAIDSLNLEKSEQTTNTLMYQQATENYNQLEKSQQQLIDESYKAYQDANEAYHIFLESKNEIKEETENEVEKETGKIENNESTAKTEELLKNTMLEAKSEYDHMVSSKESTMLAAKHAIEQLKVQVPSMNTSAMHELERGNLAQTVVNYEAILAENGEVRSTTTGVVDQLNLVEGGMTQGYGDIIIAGLYDLNVTILFDQEDGEGLIQGVPVDLDGKETIALNQLIYEEDEIGNVVYKGIGKLSEEQIKKYEDEKMTNPFMPGKMMNVKVQEEEMDGVSIPLTALNIGSQGKYFVYVVREEKEILGTVKIVEQVVVEILAKDEKYAIVDGVVENDEVVCQTTKLLQNKSKVKYSDNQGE